MYRIFIIMFIVGSISACNNSTDKTSEKKDTVATLPPEKPQEQVQGSLTEIIGCFSDPDTSLSGIKLDNTESARTLLNEKDKIDDYDQYHFYSKTHNETLSLTQHPGASQYEISVFKVELSNKADRGYRKLDIETFTTEKGVKLGITKEEIIEKFGHCYLTKDSVKDYIELYYRIESPHDSRTGILKSANMPIYYASYKIRKNKLEKFEFGFEYP